MKFVDDDDEMSDLVYKQVVCCDMSRNTPTCNASSAAVPVHSAMFNSSETNELPPDVLESCMLLSASLL